MCFFFSFQIIITKKRNKKIIARNTKMRLGADMGKPVEEIHYNSLETLVTFYQQALRNNLEDWTL